MRCLGPLCGLVLCPLVLTAGTGLILGSLACLAGACAWAGDSRPGTCDTEGTEAGVGVAGAPEPARRPRRRGRVR